MTREFQTEIAFNHSSQASWKFTKTIEVFSAKVQSLLDVISQIGYEYPGLGYDQMDGSIDTLGLQHP